jgi:hypothetical protein
VVIIFLVENTIPFSFLIVASAPASTPTSTSASPAPAASPLIGVRWTRRVRDQALRISLWIEVFLGVFAVQTENAPRIGVRGVFGVASFPLAGLISFRRLFLLGLLFHTHPEVII